ncbi:aldose epimerase family protein [Sphingomonas sp.]|uniref:aldose epimerase family protein n=1 Tax=Sphingomonas sp. TaxID=28214 RepID=UPI0035676025
MSRIPTIAIALLALLAAASPGAAAQAERRAFGTLQDGTTIEAITLTNRHGVKATILTWGATLQSLLAPDRKGRLADVVLGYADMASYERNNSFFGVTVGRFANRIAGGRFVLDGRTYTLPSVNGRVANLHGGTRGFDKIVWQVESVKDGPSASVTFSHVSPDGDQGFPGTLTVHATFSLDEQDRLQIEYRATTDKPTIVSMTNHSYFTMAGEDAGHGSDNRLTVFADGYTPVDKDLIPTGKIVPVAGTPFDFRTPRSVDARVRDVRDPQILIGRGYDHNFVLRDGHGAVRLAARLSDPASGRTLELSTNQPGLQVYSGNGLNGAQIGKAGRAYRQGDGVALEAENFPDAVNHPDFPSARLDPGGEYRNLIVLKLSAAPAGKY